MSVLDCVRSIERTMEADIAEAADLLDWAEKYPELSDAAMTQYQHALRSKSNFLGLVAEDVYLALGAYFAWTDDVKYLEAIHRDLGIMPIEKP